MTILLFAVGALAAAAGTRVAALCFVAAAAYAGTRGVGATVVAVWTAALAAAWVLIARDSIRALALPAVGAAATIAAGLAPNAAVVLGLWVLGTASAAVAAGDTDEGRRWALRLCILDVPLVAAVATTAAGLQGWPATLEAPASALLLAAAGLRALHAAGPSEDGVLPGLLIVRAQTALLAMIAVSAGGGSVAEAAVAGGAIAFGLAAWAERGRVTDVVQELSLVAIAAAATELGWTARGWVWGALAAGTLIHQLRFIVGRGTAGQYGEISLWAGGLGLPFLPIIVALLEGSLDSRGWHAAVLAVGLTIGLAGRSRRVPQRRGRRTRSLLDDIRVPAFVALAVAASLSASALSLPRPPGGSDIGWPGTIGAAFVVAAGVAGARVRGVVGTRMPAPRAAPARVLPRLSVFPLPASRIVLAAAVAALVCSAVGMWVVGLSRGFL